MKRWNNNEWKEIMNEIMNDRWVQELIHEIKVRHVDDDVMEWEERMDTLVNNWYKHIDEKNIVGESW